MDDVDALIARASALAGKCHDKKTRQQLLKILDVILSLVETGMAGSSPAPLGAQKPAPPSTHGSGHKRLDLRYPRSVRTDELRNGKGGLLVAASIEDAESAWGAALDTVAVYPEAKVAVVCSVPWDDSVRHLVTLSDGGHQDVWSRFQNLALPTVHCKAVNTLQPTTQVCLFQVRAAYVHAATWDTAMKAAQSVRIMAKKAAEAEGLRMDWSAVFTKVHRRQGVCEVSVRVPIVDVQKLLRSSGKAGTFWKALSFVNGTDTMPAVWVSDCTLEEARRLAAQTPNTFGVIAGTKTGVFSIRTTPEHVAATESSPTRATCTRVLPARSRVYFD
ncbi:hypothetical protein DIPPA_21132 [Diplonema papillatum]|nr:hypothetical protein DIPPA_33456 [Diplonema papillatum]KAJ9445276.1 hypothetical protein DIPPA_21132 [Diplonema papillatum]